MNSTLKVSSIALDIVHGDKNVNLLAAEHAIASLPADNDVVVLPEFFSTGFISDKEELAEVAEPGSGRTMQLIAELARCYNMAICGTFAARVAHQFFNRGFFVEPSGEEIFYDKRHLFGLSPEVKTYRGGEMPMPIVRFRGWNIALMICYDLRFPVWSRNVDNAYDVLLVPANWPKVRSYAWEHLLIARAIENQAYVVGANRSGKDAHCNYDNLTYILDYLGQHIGKTVIGSSVVTATLSYDALSTVRSNFPVSADADRFRIDL